MLKINITNLEDGEKSFDFIISPKDLDIDFVDIIDNIFVNAVLYKSKSQITVNISIEGKFNLQCDRCLDDYVHDFENTFYIIYKFVYGKIKIEESTDDIKFISPNTRYIDLKEDVRDYILLSIPMRKVPEERDEICIYCNKDVSKILNINKQEEINPVWEKLIKAKTK